MIASLRGKLTAKSEGQVVIETGGVGYRLQISAETYKQLPTLGEEASLLTEMIVREDSITLYGFGSPAEREMFLLLITVSGVGPRVAISALSTASPAQLARALAGKDSAFFQAVPGIGKRTAERIVLELGDKADAVTAWIEPGEEAGAGGDAEAITLARSGLIGLGYDPAEAERLLAGVDGSNAQDLIAAALREAAKG